MTIFLSLCSTREVLLEHQKNCEKSGKYVEAEMAKRRLAELKVEFEKRSKTEMK